MYIYLTLFFYLLSRIVCIIEQQPIFTSQPVDVGPLFSGTRGILQCTASGTPPVQYKWLKNGQPLTNKSTTNGGVYLISQADRSKDIGHYQCIAENRLGSVLSNKAHLTVAYMDQLRVSYSTEIRVKSGRAAVIKLPKIYDAYPAPTIEWFAGGALIEPNAKFAITKDYDLVVLRCDKADEKSYYVEVSSIHTGARIRSREIRLYVTDNMIFNDNFASYGPFDSSDMASESTDLEFVVKPTDSIAKLNDNLVKFDCIVNSRKHPLDQIEINWYKDHQLIDFIKTKYHLSSRSLEIISVTDQDAGVYTCTAKYNVILNQPSDAASINASATLDVYIKPTFKSQPESLIETDYGKTVQLKCDGISNPPANITWYKNAEAIDFDKQTNFKQTDSGTRLVISDISLKEQAIYQCFLSNDAGHISASTLLKIISFAPKFTENIKNQTVYSDSNIELSCGLVDGSPKPKIIWSKIDYFSNQNEPYSGSFRENFPKFIETDDQNNDALLLRNVNHKNQGWYKCEASNILGKVSATMYLQVKKKTEIIEPPMNISVTKGQSALFKCKVSKEQDIEIDLKWKFNDQILDLSPHDYDSYNSQYPNLRLYKNGTLQILEAKNTDIGTYKCLVTSLNNIEAGEDEKTAYLNVVELPYAPFNLNAELNLAEKRSVNLTWQSSFDGNSPILKYIIHAKINSFDSSLAQYEQTDDWFVIKDNVLVTPYFYFNNQPQVYWSIIYDLKPAYTYEFRVSAVNGIGEGMASRASNKVTIPEEAPSQPPQNIQAYSIDSRTISLQWQMPVVSSWNGRLKGYQIAYSLSYPNSTWKHVQIDDPNTNKINLTGLIVWETYLIKLSAFNSKGYGRQSHPPLRIRTKEGIPIRPPLNFKANSLNSTCIQMSWNEPPAQFVNGLIQGYKLLFYEHNQTNARQEKAIFTNHSHKGRNGAFNYEMCDLSKFTLYTLSLLCFTSSGDGPLTQPIQLKTLEDVPGEVSDVLFNNVYDTSVDIEWRAPLQPNGRILAYVISYKPAVNGSKFENIVVDSSQLNFTIRNLKSSTEYIIGLRAKTQAGEGIQKLLQIKSGVPPELPEPPKAIVLRSIGQTHVELEFIPGYNGKTSINKWIVEALQVFNSKYSSKWVQVYEKSNAPNATKLTVSNLKPFTNYTLRMFAKNVKGISKPSQSTEVFQTLPDVPSYTPQYLSARLENLFINSTRNLDVLLKWSPIPTSKWNGIPLGYVLFVTECFTNLTDTIEIKFNKYKQTNFLLKNIGAYKCYQISISAWNSVGLGPRTYQDNILILNRTSQCKPSNYTYNVNLYTVNSTAIRITWSALDKAYWNGILTGYLIKYTPTESPSNDLTTPINYYDFDETGENTDNDLAFLSNYKQKDFFYRITETGEKSKKFETLLSGLLSFTNYKIEISACTRAGCGPSSLPVSLKTLDYLPSRPVDLNFPYVNLTNVKLEFGSPRYPNGLINSFRIRYSLKRSPNRWKYAYLNWSQNQSIYFVEVNNLLKMEYYIFEVCANNSWGFGESARTIVYTIDNLSRLRPDRPSRPTVQKSSIKTTELTISWNTNSDNYSPIRFFQIQIAENSSEWRTVYLYKNANANLNNNFMLKIKGKDKLGSLIIKPNGYLYKFRIASTNDIGTSEFSEESVAVTTKQDLPELNLFDLNASVVDANRIELQWLERIDKDAKLTKFKVAYRLVQEEDPDSIMINEIIVDYNNTSQNLVDPKSKLNQNPDVNTHQYTLTSQNLNKIGKYEIEICAINAIGQSPNCLKSKKLIYIEDRLPLYDKSMIQSVKALSSTEINITWKTPTEEFINGNLYGYKISCINNELLDTKKLSEYFSNQVSLMDDDFINIIIVEPELNSILLNNLKPYKNYTILIQVINQAGESTLPFNEVNLLDGSIRAQTFESIPSMPSKILFSYISFTYLNLTFFKPIEPNGKILSYELWYENVPTESSTTKIVRQEISTNFPNQTVHISNLEPMIFYNFKVRCKTSIGWGSYLEKMVYTGPKLKKFYKSLPSNSLLEEAPLAPSKPVFSSLNSTHSILEWKAYSNDYELFIIEIKFLNPSSHFENLTTFEFFSYSNSTKLIINRYEKKLENLAPKNQNLCIFRVFSFNKISISEPSPDSDYIHTNKLATSESMASINFSNPNFYLNWWFLVIIALGSVTILIIVVLIMLLRGKNKKFVKKQQQKEQMQHKMNTIKLMKMNQDADSSDNLNSIYLAGSNQQLILTNTTNTLSRGTNNHVTLYEIRKSKRANNNGTLKTGTYVSPNGTLSRINIVDSSDLTDSNSATLIKQQQINSLNNPRVLGNLLNLGPNNMAQPNDYTTSKVGAFLINENGTLKNNHYLMPLNKNDVLDGNEEEGEESRQHLYFQHMATHYGQAGANLNFNYSSSDTENDSNFNQMTTSCASKRQIYSTFGRQGTERTNIHSLPPPPPALLTSSVLNTEPENFEERRSNINYQSNRNANMYFDHQQVMDMKEQNKQSQPMYHYHQGPLIVDSSPPPAPPPPSMTHNGANTLRMSTKSPYIAKKPPVSSSMPRIQPSAIKAAASSHGEIKNNQAMRTSQNLSENYHSSSKKSENNNTAEGNFVNNGKLSNDNNSFNLSGDRVVMSNVAGSRRPVASGYSFF